MYDFFVVFIASSFLSPQDCALLACIVLDHFLKENKASIPRCHGTVS